MDPTSADPETAAPSAEKPNSEPTTYVLYSGLRRVYPPPPEDGKEDRGLSYKEAHQKAMELYGKEGLLSLVRRSGPPPRERGPSPRGRNPKTPPSGIPEEFGDAAIRLALVRGFIDWPADGDPVLQEAFAQEAQTLIAQLDDPGIAPLLAPIFRIHGDARSRPSAPASPSFHPGMRCSKAYAEAFLPTPSPRLSHWAGPWMRDSGFRPTSRLG